MLNIKKKIASATKRAFAGCQQSPLFYPQAHGTVHIPWSVRMSLKPA